MFQMRPQNGSSGCFFVDTFLDVQPSRFTDLPLEPLEEVRNLSGVQFYLKHVSKTVYLPQLSFNPVTLLNTGFPAPPFW